eukprot:205765_1
MEISRDPHPKYDPSTINPVLQKAAFCIGIESSLHSVTLIAIVQKTVYLKRHLSTRSKEEAPIRWQWRNQKTFQNKITKHQGQHNWDKVKRMQLKIPQISIEH